MTRQYNIQLCDVLGMQYVRNRSYPSTTMKDQSITATYYLSHSTLDLTTEEAKRIL